MGGSDRSMVLCVFMCVCVCVFVFVEADRHKHIWIHCPALSLCLVYRLKRTTQDLCLMRRSMWQRCYYWSRHRRQTLAPILLPAWFKQYAGACFIHVQDHWIIKHVSKSKGPSLCIMSSHKSTVERLQGINKPFFISVIGKRKKKEEKLGDGT